MAVLKETRPANGPQTHQNGDTAETDSEPEYITVCLADIRKEMQCPICLGIIRKTRTVMECLHRFCRECIDKAMRLGNNECPACRVHCASRRSLRDDPKFDNLVTVLYPDLDKHEEEDSGFNEEESWRNKLIQDRIAEIFRKQTLALSKRRGSGAAGLKGGEVEGFGAVQTGRRFSRGLKRRRTLLVDEEEADEEEEEEEDEEMEEEDPEDMEVVVEDGGRRTGPKRARRRPPDPEFVTDLPASSEEEVEEEGSEDEEAAGPLPERAPHRQWESRGSAKGRDRPGGGLHGVAEDTGTETKQLVRCPRAARLMDALLESAKRDKDEELEVHFSLHPAGGDSDGEETLPALERSHMCCSAAMTVRHLCKFLESSVLEGLDDDLEILIPSSAHSASGPDRMHSASSSGERFSGSPLDVLAPHAKLGDIASTKWEHSGDLVLFYRLKS